MKSRASSQNPLGADSQTPDGMSSVKKYSKAKAKDKSIQ